MHGALIAPHCNTTTTTKTHTLLDYTSIISIVAIINTAAAQLCHGFLLTELTVKPATAEGHLISTVWEKRRDYKGGEQNTSRVSMAQIFVTYCAFSTTDSLRARYGSARVQP